MSEEGELFQPTQDWKPIVRISRTIPFGYKIDEEDGKLLQPIVFELEALEKAKKHLKNGYSYRNVSDWLSGITGRNISHMGLKKRIENERNRRRKATALKVWAGRYKAAIEKAEALEGRIITNPNRTDDDI